MDITDTLAPRSDQQNYEDYLTGPKTVTVSEVRVPGGEQPVEIHLVEFPGRPFKPAKTVRRQIVAAWGPNAAEYVGRRMTLYGDPKVRFGGQEVGGIRVSHMSHIDKPVTVSLTTTRGKRAPFTVQPLPDAPRTPDLKALAGAFKAAGITDKAGMLAFAVQVAGRDLASAGDLTPEEVDRVVAALRDKVLDVPTEEPPAGEP